jgi:predicted phosphodiesterase
MRIAVISDIHGNMDALESVFADMDAARIDVIFSLGDNIGYGPEPEKVVKQLQDRRIPSVLGNHELAVNKPLYLKLFNPAAKRSIEKTATLLSENAIAYIAGLPNMRTFQDCRFVHGFPPESPVTYLFQASDAALEQAFDDTPERLCFVGHTHELALLGHDGGELFRQPLLEGKTRLDQNHRYLINAGSVGQPRDGNNNAKYMIWDSDEGILDVRFVAYDIARVVDKIMAAGLPEVHALRLW